MRIKGTASADTLVGGQDPDRLDGLAGDDILIGGLGADTLVGGQGADTMEGGGDNDLHYVDDPGDVVVELAGGGTDTMMVGFSSKLRSVVMATEVENFIVISPNQGGTAQGNALNNLMIAGAAAVHFQGRGGSDRLVGGNGADTLDGGAGGDLMQGGAGNDTYVVDLDFDVVDERVDGGIDTVRIFVGGYTLPDHVENAVLFLPGPFFGNGLANGVTGSYAADYIEAGGGDDTVRGGSGSDMLVGGDGHDRLAGETGDDLLEGGAGNDTLNGGTGDDELAGEAGDDSLNGAMGDDALEGGLGNDWLVGGAGDDEIVGGLGDDTAQGGVGDDVLSGGGGNDLLRGGTGNDILEGGAGRDILVGGLGADIFVLSDYLAEADIIRDFDRQHDKIDLSAFEPLFTTLILDWRPVFEGDYPSIPEGTIALGLWLGEGNPFVPIAFFTQTYGDGTNFPDLIGDYYIWV